MKLIQLLKEELRQELNETLGDYQAVCDLAKRLGTSGYTLNLFLESDDNAGMISADFINDLFERYYDIVIETYTVNHSTIKDVVEVKRRNVDYLEIVRDRI